MDKIEIGEIYQHYKGKSYKIIALARHSEDPNSILVIYQGQYICPTFGPNPTWARPYEMFVETIFNSGKEQPRFKKNSN